MGAEVYELHPRNGSRKERGRGLEAEANRLVGTYSDLILRVSYTYLHSTHDAQDIAQQVFMKLLTGGYGFRDAQHERAWIVRSTINACKDLLRSAARRTTVDLDEATWLEAPRQEHEDVLEATNCPASTAKPSTCTTTRGIPSGRSPSSPIRAKRRSPSG